MHRANHPPIPPTDDRRPRGCLAKAPDRCAPSRGLAGPCGGQGNVVQFRPGSTVEAIDDEAFGTVAAKLALRFAQEGAQ